MTGRIVNVRPKPGFVLDGQDVVAASNVVSMPTRDGLASLMTGRGTSIDRNASDGWMFMGQSPQQLVAGFRSNWLVSKIVLIPAEDMVREWRDWQADEQQIETLEHAERAMGIVSKVQQGIVYGRLGGGVMLLGYGDADPATPAPKVGKDGLKYVHVFNRWEVGLGEMDRDIASPWFGQPSYYTITSDKGQVQIHPSRMIVFRGEPVPMMPGVSYEDHFWGDSIITRVDQAVKNAIKTNDGFAALVDEAKIDIFRMGGMTEMLGQPGGEDRVRRRMEITNVGKSIWRGVYMDKEDEWEQRQLSLAGMPDLIETLLAVVAGAADIPATRLLGRAPQGMNSTGEGDEKNYNTMIRAKQRLYLSPAVDRLDEALIPSALGTRPPEVSYVWAPLSVPTEKEQAETFKLMAESAGIIADKALAPEAVLQEAFKTFVSDGQLLPGWDKAWSDFEAGLLEGPGDEDDLGIVPLSKGGDPDPTVGAGGPTSPGSPRRAANDALPRTLYVQRKVENVAELKVWAKSQGLPDLQDDLHVTIIYSRTPLDWIKAGNASEWGDKDGKLVIAPGGPRAIEPLGDRTAVMLFASSELYWRHKSIVDAGASHDYDDYQPHISLTAEPVDLSNIEPYRGKIVLGPEIFEELRSEGA